MNPIILILGLAAVVFQATSAAASEAPSKNISPENYPVYKLRAGDIVSLSVFRQERLELKGVAITADGVLKIIAIRDGLHVAGLSVAEAQALVTGEYKKSGLVADPQVTIKIEEYAGHEHRVPNKPDHT
jgi:protein involved in polysaccharide export with SLBB domain